MTGIEAARNQWREMEKALEEVRRSSHPGASLLSFYRDRMVSSRERLLELGMDVSSIDNPRTVPIPVSRRPKTRADARRWDEEMSFEIARHTLGFAVAGVGSHVVYSAVGDTALVDVLAQYVQEPAVSKEELAPLVSRSYLQWLALACALWLLEPTEAPKSSRRELDAACFKRMRHAMEIWVLGRVGRQAKGEDGRTDAERRAAVDAMAGWSLAHLSLEGMPGGALRRALGEDVPKAVRYARFLQELPSASLVAWEEREAQEPLRPTGEREKNLVRRVSEIIEKAGNEDAVRPGKVIHEPFGATAQDTEGHKQERFGEADELLEEFEREETLREQIARAELSEQEKQVCELDMQTDEDTKRIAYELGITEGHVRVVRKNYRDKIREAAGF